MITLLKAKEILCKDGKKFSESEVKKIIKFLLELAEINVEQFLKQ
jgi:hypothetical protein